MFYILLISNYAFILSIKRIKVNPIDYTFSEGIWYDEFKMIFGGQVNMTRIVIAADSFKGSASSRLVAERIAEGIKRVDQSVEVQMYLIADGGEGTVEAILEMTKGTYHYVAVRNPYGKRVRARFGMLNDTTAIIETAEASGLQYKEPVSDPAVSTTHGTGELIKAALDLGAEHLYIGLGGSATIDGGSGMLQALGVKLLDRSGNEIGSGLEELKRLDRIDATHIDPRIHTSRFTILSDVTNPLTGNNGATAVFGPQKGVKASDVEPFDRILKMYAEIVEKNRGKRWSTLPGAGAAGGLGFGLLAFCDAEMTSGIEKVLNLIKLEVALPQADLVITGEGKMDGQSIQGKAPIGIAKLAKKYNLPVIAIVGGRDDDVSEIYKEGIDLIIDIVNRPMSLTEAILNVESLLIEAGETAYRAFKLNKKEEEG